jgi:hypothetical protein
VKFLGGTAWQSSIIGGYRRPGTKVRSRERPAAVSAKAKKEGWKVSPEPNLLARTAIHEAGHAVIGLRQRDWVRERGVSIDLRNPGNGNTHIRRIECSELAAVMRELGGAVWRNWQARVERSVIMTLAGPFAELRYVLGRSPAVLVSGETGELDDLREVRRLTATIGLEYADLTAWMFNDQTKRMLLEKRTWAAVLAMGSRLLEHGVISGDEAEALCIELKVPRISRRVWIGEDCAGELGLSK